MARSRHLPDPASAVDGRGLRAALTAAFRLASGDGTEQRRLAVAILKDALQVGRATAERRLADHGGLAAAQALSATADAVVQALYAFTTLHVARASNPTEGERLALVAVGGYGRGALAPHSDIDLLFLRAYKRSPHTESVVEFMLYVLWDLGLRVGHASRTVEESVKLALADSTVATALVDTRPLAGDERLYKDLRRAFRVAAGTTGSAFVAAKLAERDERHARAGGSRYLVQPNVKESKGGLRDIHTLLWIAGYLTPDRDRAPNMDARLRGLDRGEVAALWRASDFLWAVRCSLHLAAGRAQEQLTFDWQPEVAGRLGYGDGGPESVKRLMRRYFHTTRQVGSVTRAFCAELETRQAIPRPAGLTRFLPGAVREPVATLAPGFLERSGRLDVDRAKVFARDPVNLVRLFQLADRHDLDLHPRAVALVRRSLHLLTAEVRREPDAAAAFLDILARGRSRYRILSLMNDTGVLGRLAPEFGRIVGESQFDRHHAYTVDEHTLHAIDVLADLGSGRLTQDHPLASSLMPRLVDPEALFLAMLLHDVGKGQPGGQEAAGAKAARKACLRLGLSPARAELVAWLVGRHLLMSDTAQTRDLSDPATIERFARAVGDVERLRLLLVLTVADIRAVAPGVWNGWKGQLLRGLYAATAAWLGQGAVDGTRGESEYLGRADLLHQAERNGAAARSAPGPAGATTEVAVAAADRQGLFADLAAVLSSHGAQVVGADAYTGPSGQVLDIFQLQDRSGNPFGAASEASLPELLRMLEAAGRGEHQSRELARRKRRASGDRSSSVVVDQDASERSTVVETSGPDRPGLLADLSRVITRQGLSIRSAHVSSSGERAVDVFYVQTRDGQKLPADVAEALKTALAVVIDAAFKPEPPLHAQAGARQLQA